MNQIFLIFIFLCSLSNAPVWASTQVIISTNENDIAPGSTFYHSIMGTGGTADTGTRENSNQVVPAAGTFKNFQIYLAVSAGGAGESYAFTIHKNNAATSATCTIDVANTYCRMPQFVTVAAGDLIALETDPTGAPDSNNHFSWAVDFVPTTPNETIIMGLANGAVPNGVVSNWLLSGKSEAITPAANQSKTLFPVSGTLKRFYTATNNTQAAKGYSLKIVNSAGTTIGGNVFSCQMSSAATACVDAAATTAITAGDQFYVVSTPAGTPTASRVKWSTVFVPTVSNTFIIQGSSSDFLTGGSAGTPEYMNIAGADGVINTTTSTKYVLGRGGVQLKTMRVALGLTVPGGTKAFALMEDGNPTGMTCTINDTSSRFCTSTVRTKLFPGRKYQLRHTQTVANAGSSGVDVSFEAQDTRKVLVIE